MARASGRGLHDSASAEEMLGIDWSFGGAIDPGVDHRGRKMIPLSKMLGLRSIPKIIDHVEPSLDRPVWQMCTASQLDEGAYKECIKALFLPPLTKHRKLWEWAFIRTALLNHLGTFAGKRGLVFGVGREPLAANFAGEGAIIVA